MSSFQRQKYIKQLDRLYKRLETVAILKDEKGYNKLLKQLTTALVNTYDTQRTDSLKEVISYLTSLEKDTFDQKDVDSINSMVQVKMGSELHSLVQSSVDDLTEKIFKFGKREILSSLKIRFSFDIPDKEAVNFLKYFNNFWVQNHYDSYTRDKLAATLNGYFASNSTLEQVATDFARDFGQLTDKGISYFKNLAHITTNRTRSVGQVNGLEKAGVKGYELFNPDPESEICQQMNGTFFPIERALNWRDDFLSLSDPEDIKSKFAWVSQNELGNYFDDSGEMTVDTEELPDSMVIPPLHGGACKTTIRAVL